MRKHPKPQGRKHWYSHSKIPGYHREKEFYVHIKDAHRRTRTLRESGYNARVEKARSQFGPMYIVAKKRKP